MRTTNETNTDALGETRGHPCVRKGMEMLDWITLGIVGLVVLQGGRINAHHCNVIGALLLKVGELNSRVAGLETELRKRNNEN